MPKLHSRLAEDCYTLGNNPAGQLLLHKNACVPWLILVPDTELDEIYKLDDSQQALIHQQVAELATFSERHFSCDKLNIATIGNVVPQLHIHIISRFKNDIWWPEPVWGKPDFKAYEAGQVDNIKQALIKYQLINA